MFECAAAIALRRADVQRRLAGGGPAAGGGTDAKVEGRRSS